MAKKKKNREKRWSIDDKYTGKKLAICNTEMDAIKKEIGKGGDFTANAKTLIGSVEFLNNEATDGATLMDAYNNFNKVTLVDLRRQLGYIDEHLQYLDRIAK